jgi:hypothetical protein
MVTIPSLYLQYTFSIPLRDILPPICPICLIGLIPTKKQKICFANLVLSEKSCTFAVESTIEEVCPTKSVSQWFFLRVGL